MNAANCRALSGVSDIEPVRDDLSLPVRGVLRRCLRLGGIAGGEDDHVARGDQLVGDLAADAAVRAGDHADSSTHDRWEARAMICWLPVAQSAIMHTEVIRHPSPLRARRRS